MSAAPTSGGPDPAFPEHFLFDLDDTLYPASSGFFALVSARITEYIRSHVGLEESHARVLQRRYWRRYGTSLRGLMVRHAVDPEPFLAFVHDVPVEEHLRPDPALRDALVAVRARRHLFTNAPAAYAARVLSALGVGDLFERVFDIASFGYVPKPNPEPYDAVERALGTSGRRLALVDDALRNLPPARERGWLTIWLRGASGEVADGSAPDVVIERLVDLSSGIGAALRSKVGSEP